MGTVFVLLAAAMVAALASSRDTASDWEEGLTCGLGLAAIIAVLIWLVS